MRFSHDQCAQLCRRSPISRRQYSRWSLGGGPCRTSESPQNASRRRHSSCKALENLQSKILRVPLCPLWLFFLISYRLFPENLNSSVVEFPSIGENLPVPTQTEKHQLRFRLLPERFAICRLDPTTALPDWALHPAKLASITRTSDELSIVCLENHVPPESKSDAGWIALKLEGPFPFSMTGVLASFINPLSDSAIPIFAISTFDTDYVLIKHESLTIASAALESAGHKIAS